MIKTNLKQFLTLSTTQGLTKWIKNSRELKWAGKILPVLKSPNQVSSFLLPFTIEQPAMISIYKVHAPYEPF